jgi:hypothetical protein
MSGPNGESEEQQDADWVWTTWDAVEKIRIQTNNVELMDGYFELCDKHWPVTSSQYSNKQIPTSALLVEFVVPSIPS